MKNDNQKKSKIPYSSRRYQELKIKMLLAWSSLKSIFLNVLLPLENWFQSSYAQLKKVEHSSYRVCHVFYSNGSVWFFFKDVTSCWKNDCKHHDHNQKKLRKKIAIIFVALNHWEKKNYKHTWWSEDPMLHLKLAFLIIHTKHPTGH